MEEAALGAAFGASLGFFVGPIMGVAAALGCAFLWALGGAENSKKAWRRLGVPLVALDVFILAHVPIKFPLVLASTGAAFGVLTIGYGIPSTQPPDAGSWLGRFFYKLAGSREVPAALLTRGTLALLLALAYLPLAWVNGGAYLRMTVTLVGLQLLAVRFVEGSFTL